MKKVRTYNTIAVKGLERFPRNTYEVASEIEHADAFILRSQKLHDEVFPDDLIAIARAGAGTNNVPVERCSEAGIVVFNTPGANANAVKELVLTGMLLSSRGITQGIQYVDTLSEMDDKAVLNKELEAQKKQFKGSEIAGKTLGIVGLGAIGSLVANMALDMGMKVAGYDPAISIEAAWRLSSDVEKMDSLQQLVAKADYISLHVPAIEPTIGLINKDVLSIAKPGLRILNFAREEIVDEAALLEALEARQVDRYITDFPTPALIGRGDVILMPHIGASTAEAEENCAVMAADQLMDYIENGHIKNSVNFPPAVMPRVGGTRVTICNENVSGVLGQILSVLAEAEINVIDMLNKSRNDVAYNIIDVEQTPDQSVIERMQALEHVVRVRVIDA